MKITIVLLSILVAASSFAQEAKPLQQMNLSELSEAKKIRPEKLQELFVPNIELDEVKLPLEKIDSGVTDTLIRETLEEYIANRTLQDLSGDTEYPIKKLRDILGLNISKSGYTKPLRAFGIFVPEINQAIEVYEERQPRFIWNIVATGMIIVFISLIFTGLVVALLEYFHRLDIQRLRNKATPGESETVDEGAATATEPASRKTRREQSAAAKKKSSDEALDAHSIVAIATAIRLHEASIEESNRILVTWKRASVSMWKANRVMPNGKFYDKRRG